MAATRSVSEPDTLNELGNWLWIELRAFLRASTSLNTMASALFDRQPSSGSCGGTVAKVLSIGFEVADVSVFGREIVECEQGLAIFAGTRRLIVFELVGCDEGVERGLGVLLVSASRSPVSRLALGCWLFGSLLRTLAVLCTQQRCSRVAGHSSPSAFQKPSAPSATASSGVTTRPRFCKSISSSRRSCALSRAPSVKPSSSFLPPGGADDHQDASLGVFEAGCR